MRFQEIDFAPSPRTLRVFGALWLAAFGLAGALAAWRGSAWAPAAWAVALAGGVAGLAAPRALRPIYVAWMVAAFPVAWTVSLLLLAAVYYAVITPIGLAFRLAGRDALGRRFDRGASSYWVRRPPPPDLARYFRQF